MNAHRLFYNFDLIPGFGGKYGKFVNRYLDTLVDAGIGYFKDNPRSRYQYYAQGFLAGFSRTYGAWYSARDSVRQMDNYMDNRNLSWSNIKYPSKTIGFTGASGYGALANSGLNFVSDNIKKLYG